MCSDVIVAVVIELMMTMMKNDIMLTVFAESTNSFHKFGCDESEDTK